MATPTAWDSTTEPLCGENDPFARKDTANQYAKELWDNLTAEHYKETGGHRANYGLMETGTYTGTSRKKTVVSLANSNLIINKLEIAAHAASRRYVWKTSDMDGVSGGDGSLAIESNSTDGSTTFTDLYGTHTITSNGGAKHSTDITQGWGTTSMYFDGTDDYLSVPDHADWDFGTNLFCVSFDVYFIDKDKNTYACFLDHNDWRIWYEDGNTRITVTIEGTAYHFTWTPSEATWYRVEVYRDGSDILKVAVDGTNLGTEPGIVADITGSTDSLTIGCDISATSTHFFNGYLDDIYIGSWATATDLQYDWTYSATTEVESARNNSIWRLGTGKFQLGHDVDVQENGITYSYVVEGIVS